MADKISMDELGIYLTDLVEKELQNKEETMEEILNKRAMQLKGKLNTISPKNTGAYSKGWRIKTVQRNHEPVKVIYNAAKPHLTYILEYGNSHQRAQPHIRRACEEAIDDIMEELINRL